MRITVCPGVIVESKFLNISLRSYQNGCTHIASSSSLRTITGGFLHAFWVLVSLLGLSYIGWCFSNQEQETRIQSVMLTPLHLSKLTGSEWISSLWNLVSSTETEIKKLSSYIMAGRYVHFIAATGIYILLFTGKGVTWLKDSFPTQKADTWASYRRELSDILNSSLDILRVLTHLTKLFIPVGVMVYKFLFSHSSKHRTSILATILWVIRADYFSLAVLRRT